MNRDEYELMYRTEDRHWWYAALRKMLEMQLERFELRDGSDILDAGCGTGATMRVFGGRFRFVGLDPSQDALRFSKSRELGRLVGGSATELPFRSERFDAVTSMDVLCNRGISDKQLALNEMARVTRTGGLLFVNVPAYQWLLSSHDRAVHNDRRFVKQELENMMRETGWRPAYATYWNTLLFPAAAGMRLARKATRRERSDLAGGEDTGQSETFNALLAFERALIRKCPMPFGLSIFAVGRKEQQ